MEEHSACACSSEDFDSSVLKYRASTLPTPREPCMSCAFVLTLHTWDLSIRSSNFPRCLHPRLAELFRARETRAHRSITSRFSEQEQSSHARREWYFWKEEGRPCCVNRSFLGERQRVYICVEARCGFTWLGLRRICMRLACRCFGEGSSCMRHLVDVF